MATLLPSNDPFIQRIRPGDVISYLQLIGWILVDAANPRWFVLQGAADVNGEPFELVLPKSRDDPDFNYYLSSAVELLADLANDTEYSLVKKIALFDSDVLNVRNLETGNAHSITLKLAARQVNKLKSLVAYSACSEQEPSKAYFPEATHKTAKRMVEHYRFGHTFDGSFGFSIESPIVHQPVRYVQLRLEEMVEPVQYSPFERRVMERIARGLLFTWEATESGSPQVLVDRFTSAFNSNMCSALAEMSHDGARILEYSIIWSPKIRPSDDLTDSHPVRIGRLGYEILRTAAEELKEKHPEFITIQGLVTHLISKDDPSLQSAERSVVIRWTSRDRPANVIVHLEREDYAKAHEAHWAWSTVRVTGVLQRSGSVFVLVQPEDFRILN